MPKAYIAAPFTSKMTNKKHGLYGEVTDESYKDFLLTIECNIFTFEASMVVIFAPT